MKKLLSIIALSFLMLNSAYALESSNTINYANTWDSFDVTCPAGSNNVKSQVMLRMADTTYAVLATKSQNVNTGATSSVKRVHWTAKGQWSGLTTGTSVSGAQTVRVHFVREGGIGVTPYRWFIQCYAGATPKGVATFAVFSDR
jgi:hypothetical protein